MIISASHMVFDEASTCDSLQLTFSLVPKLVGRSMMDEYGEPKGLGSSTSASTAAAKGTRGATLRSSSCTAVNGHRLASAEPTVSSDREGCSATWYPGPNRSAV